MSAPRSPRGRHRSPTRVPARRGAAAAAGVVAALGLVLSAVPAFTGWGGADIVRTTGAASGSAARCDPSHLACSEGPVAARDAVSHGTRSVDPRRAGASTGDAGGDMRVASATPEGRTAGGPAVHAAGSSPKPKRKPSPTATTSPTPSVSSRSTPAPSSAPPPTPAPSSPTGTASAVPITSTPSAPVPLTSDAPCVGSGRPGTYDHVLWVWFENKAPVVGAGSAPYFTSLAAACGLATDYHAITHPSLPNYLAATGGSTFGVTDDNPPSAHPLGGPSIFSQVADAGRQWRSYQESMPGPCALTSSGSYAVKHNPAAYFTGIRSDCTAWDVALGTSSSGSLAGDLAGDTLPAFAFVTPDLCNDMHDCPVSTGDSWLRQWMAVLTHSAAYRSGRTAVVITFDEDDHTAGNRVSTIVVSPSVPAGTVSAATFDHYSLLRTTEEMLGLPATLGNAATAHSMLNAFGL